MTNLLTRAVPLPFLPCSGAIPLLGFGTEVMKVMVARQEMKAFGGVGFQGSFLLLVAACDPLSS